MTRLIVVIPTVRTVCLDYLRPLIDDGARFIVVNDDEETTCVRHPSFSTFSVADRTRMLGRLERAIPSHTGACRDFGLLLARYEADPGDVIVALDDDCRVGDDFPDAARSALLSSKSRRMVRDTARHFNVLDLYRPRIAGLFPRGFPYSARVGYRSPGFSSTTNRLPSFNVGLWRHVFDVNAIDKAVDPAYTHPSARLREDSVALPSGVLISVCSMNMQMSPEVVPAAYQLPMHVPVMKGHVIDRFGDIWGGFVLKRLMDVNGDLMTVGAPLVDHLKEGAWARNAWQEHLAHLVNDEFVELLTATTADFAPDSYSNHLGRLAEELRRRAAETSPILRTYLNELLPCLEAWIRALEKFSPSTTSAVSAGPTRAGLAPETAGASSSLA
jgi:Reversibly glycosylated polypeptide